MGSGSPTEVEGRARLELTLDDQPDRAGQPGAEPGQSRPGLLTRAGAEVDPDRSVPGEEPGASRHGQLAPAPLRWKLLVDQFDQRVSPPIARVQERQEGPDRDHRGG